MFSYLDNCLRAKLAVKKQQDYDAQLYKAILVMFTKKQKKTNWNDTWALSYLKNNLKKAKTSSQSHGHRNFKA